MARLLVMYHTPKDLAAFDKHYQQTHIPLAKKIPGLRKFEVSQGPIGTPAGPAAFYSIVTLHFDDMAALQKALASPEGQAASADVSTFASGGADLLVFDTSEV